MLSSFKRKPSGIRALRYTNALPLGVLDAASNLAFRRTGQLQPPNFLVEALGMALSCRALGTKPSLTS